MVQYPYILQTLQQTDAVQDENGNWTPGGEEWVTHSKCRDESGSGRQVRGEDGSAIVVNFLVQCPLGTPAVPANTSIRVVDESENVRATGKVLYSRKDRLHTRIWV